MFRVKASYDYTSPHEDDLSFKHGQVIAVTEEVDADWCVGEFVDDVGTKHHGMFPRNFVQKYEPEPPPRPNRASRHKPLEQPPVDPTPPQPELVREEPEPVQHQEPEPEPEQEQEPQPEPPKPDETIASPISPAESTKPAPAAKKPPPPVAAKSNAFRDRIAAFNAPAAAPIQPFKPGGAPTNFIKKPFVAPPPSRNAYVPPPKEAPQVKTYRRDEDPEIAERQAQDEEAADKAGLVSHGGGHSQQGEEEEDQPKLSLKERIALLQKQQQEQAERAAGATHKEKPKRPPPKKRTESHEAPVDDSEDPGLEKVSSIGSRQRESMDQTRQPRTSHDVRSPDPHHNRDLVSENDADQSGAGDTEDAEGTSTSVEDDDERSTQRQPSLPVRAAAAPAHQQDVGDEQDVEDEDEEDEDEMDAETRRKLELRERMAKMSGGMGMGNMFNPMGMAPLPPKKKKTAEKKAEEAEEYSMPQQRVAIFPMSNAPVKSPVQEEDRSLAVEKENEDVHPITSSHKADEVADVEDVAPQPVQRTATGERPPVPSDRRPAPPPVPSASRPIPPPLPNIVSPGPGSESGDELTDAGAHTLSPRSPTSTGLAPAKHSSYFGGNEEQSQTSPDKRVPSFPLTSPTSPTAARPPPPPPPTQAPPSRHSDIPATKLDRNDGETDYEGDYDTDIASGATHKDALKSHNRDASVDDSNATDGALSSRSLITPHAVPPLPPIVPRAVPPPPPAQIPSRQSTDAPRAPPPVPPVPAPSRNFQNPDDEDYDPYRYTSPPGLPPTAPRAVPLPPQGQPPPPQARPPPPMPPSMPPVPRHQAAESSDEDDLYSAPPPRKSHDRPPPPPPQGPPHHSAPPPPPQDRAAPPPPPPQERPAPPPPPQERVAPLATGSDPQPRVSMGGRKSLDAGRALGGRTSMEQSRPTNQDFIASDVDIGASSHWWTQPKLLPPSLQNRKDILVDLSEAQSGNTIEKTINVLYMDYSQTTISASFELSNVSDVHFQQEHNPPPPKQRPDQLENAYDQFGRQIAKAVESKQNTVVGNGTPQGLIEELLRPFADALPPVSARAYGALVYANLANASTQSYDEIRPGDIISFRNAKFQGKTGPMHAKYSVEVGKPDHVGVVVEWDGSKKKVRVWEQGREHKKVKPESFKMGDLRSGEVRVWRVMSKSWIGWN